MTISNLVSATLFQHDDDRHAAWPGVESPPWTQGDPGWHRVGPVDVDAIATPQCLAQIEEAVPASLDPGALLPRLRSAYDACIVSMRAAGSDTDARQRQLQISQALSDSISAEQERDKARRERDLARAEIAGLQASTGNLSALVDGQHALLEKAKATMTALHGAASPIDESGGDFDARIPASAFARFVDAHAELLHAMAQSPVAAPAAPGVDALADARRAVATIAMVGHFNDQDVILRKTVLDMLDRLIGARAVDAE